MSAAPLNPAHKNREFQPGVTVNSPVLKPAQATVWSRNPRWAGAGPAEKITPLLRAPTRVEISGRSLAQAGDAVVRTNPVNRAGGGK